MEIRDLIEKAWDEYRYKNIPILPKNAFYDGFIAGYEAKEKDLSKRIYKFIAEGGEMTIGDMKFIEDELKENMNERQEIKMSGEVGNLDGDMRRILADCGGNIWIRDSVVSYCGGYKEGDRVTITITACSNDEFHYPKKPNK